MNIYKIATKIIKILPKFYQNFKIIKIKKCFCKITKIVNYDFGTGTGDTEALVGRIFLDRPPDRIAHKPTILLPALLRLTAIHITHYDYENALSFNFSM